MLYNRSMKFIRKTLSLLLICILLVGCTSAKHYIAYTIYPIGYILNRVGGNKINAVSIQTNDLVQLSKIKDDYKDTLNDSMVLFRVGGLEPYMDLYDDDIKETGVNIQDLSVLNALYQYKRYTPVIVDGKMNFVEGEYYENDIFKEIDTYDFDPFIWLSPIGMCSMAKDVKEYLSSNYFEQSEYFNENFEKFQDELIALDAAYNALSLQLINQNKTIKFVSMTGSFGTWQKDYGFQVYPVCLSKYGALPSDEQLNIIKQKIVNDNVHYIAYEQNMSEDMKDLFKQLEEELDLQRVTLHNISSLTSSQSESGKDYLSLMYENLSILQNMTEEISAPITQEEPIVVENSEIVEE